MKIYLYPLWLRLWHFANALLCLILIFTGISLQYSDPDQPLLMRFDLAIMTHNIVSIILCVNYLFFIIGNVVTGNIKFYYFKFGAILDDIRFQLRYYAIGMFKGEQSPFPINKERKFNSLQKITYIMIMYGALPIIIITGLALWFPEFIIYNVFGRGGIFINALLHGLIGFLLSIFIIIHIYFCTFGKTIFSDFKGIYNGWHEPKE